MFLSLQWRAKTKTFMRCGNLMKRLLVLKDGLNPLLVRHFEGSYRGG